MRDIITKLEEINVEKPQLNEGLGDMAHEAEKDHEVQMARSDCYKSAKYAVSIHKMLKDVSEMEGIDGWVASKLTKAADYLGSVKHYMEGQIMQDVELAVVPVAGDMTDAMTMPQESVEEGFKIRDKSRSYGVSDKTYKTREEAEEARLLKMASTGGDWEVIKEAEERTYIVVHAKHGKEEIKASSSYAAAKKYAEMKKLKSTAGVDAYLADEEKTATESVEEVAEGRMSMRQLASMDKDAARKIEAMVGPESKYADMGDYQEALYRAAVKMGLIRENVEEAVVIEDREVMVRATNIDYDGPALDKLPTDVNVKVMVNPGDSEDEIFDMVADELEDRYGVKVSGFDMKMMENALDETILGEKDTMMGYGGKPLPKHTPQSKAAADAAIAAAPGRTIDDMSPLERDSLKRRIRKNIMNPDGSLVNQSEPSKAHFKKMGYDKLMGVKIEDAVEEEDVIGDIIDKLNKMGVKGKSPNKPRMTLPKSKPSEPIGSDPVTGATRGLPPEEVYSQQQLQQIANQNRATKPRLQKESTFADWSKK